MMSLNKLFLISFLISISVSCSMKSETPDKEREKMIYQQNLSEIFDGEHIFLKYLYGEFSLLEIYDKKNDEGVLYLHGRGLHPNSQGLSYYIRTGLTQNYNTYSIQLPVLKKQSSYLEYTNIFYDSDERIKSAINHILLNNKEVNIIAHSCGVHMLMSYIKNNNLSSKIKSIVLIGAGAVDKGQDLIYQYPYGRISIPVLDIFGEYDFNLVIRKSSERRQIIKNISSKSKQIEIKASNHYHDDNFLEVLDNVKKWLSSQ